MVCPSIFVSRSVSRRKTSAFFPRCGRPLATSGNAKADAVPAPALGKVVVVGVGLIGGSFALALKAAAAVATVVGVGRSASNLSSARQLGIDDRTWTLEARWAGELIAA